MMHHIVLNVGPNDAFRPSVDDADVLCPFSVDSDKHAIHNTVSRNLKREGLSLSTTAEDILNLAMATYAADLFVRRSTGYDSWTRNFRLHLPVLEPDRWTESTDTVVEMLSFLTGDHWELSFRKRDVHDAEDDELGEPDFRPTAVSLFSGGLDSFIGSIERLEAGDVMALVGHHGAGTTNQAQENAYSAITESYKDKTRSFRFYVQPPTPEKGEPEKTTRSRSILFLALGTAVATSYGDPLPLYVPENGLISLNPPLTDSRMGTLSTRTTHPHFMDLFRQLVTALGTGLVVETPYRFLTKGEMAMRVIENKAFLAGVHKTVSCSHPDVGRYQGASPGQHCGYCVPCIIRRASLLKVELDEPGRYLMDIRTNRPAQGSDTNRDLRAFEMALRRFDSTDSDRHLFDVLSTGPIPPEHIHQFVDVFRRGMIEVHKFLQPGN